jgi:hypothetical protein
VFQGLGAFINGALTSAQTSLTPVIVMAGLLIGGAMWATGNIPGGRSMVIGALIGGAIMLLAVSISTAMMALPRA